MDKKELVNISIDPQILEENDPEELQELIDMFNLNMKKKDIIRSAKLSEVQDKIVDQMSKRIENRPDEFSNADLLNYHKVVQDTISKADNTLESVKVPSIQVNQQINLNNSETDSFDKESRQRILDAVNSVLASITDVTDEENNDA